MSRVRRGMRVQRVVLNSDNSVTAASGGQFKSSLRGLTLVATENSVRSENTEVPIIREVIAFRW